jgi:hypothetical protein
MAESEPSAISDQFARHLVELHGRAALRIVRSFIEQAERAGDNQAAEVWRGIEAHVRKALARISGDGSS